MRKTIFPKDKQAQYEAYGYSAAIESGEFLFVSGQVGVDDSGNPIAIISEQFDRAFENLGKTLEAAGCSFDDVVDVTSFHVDIFRHFDDFAAAKQKVFPAAPFPNWTAIGVVSLVIPGLLLEVKAIAHIPRFQLLTPETQS